MDESSAGASQGPHVVPPVTNLVGARSPADRGLAGLGLVMQLGGSVFAALTAMVGMPMMFALLEASRYGHQGGGIGLWMLVLIAAGVGRSFAHRAAGTRLLYNTEDRPLAGIKRYLIWSAAHIAIWFAFFAFKMDMPLRMSLSIVGMFALWPATLAVITRLPQFKAFEDRVPTPEDKGFEGAAILMFLLGLVGTGLSAIMIYTLLKLPGAMLSQGPIVMVLVSAVVLCIRSALHVNAGWRGLTETNLDRAVEATTRYANFAVIASFIVGGAFLLIMMMSRADISGMTILCTIVWLLLAWPLIVRRFFAERQFADLLAGDDAPVHRRSPDQGLTTLGWFLVGMAIFSLSVAIPNMLLADGSGVDGPLSLLFSGFGAPTVHSKWWAIGSALLQLWAGIELVKMSDSYRLVGTIYGAATAAITVYTAWPTIKSMTNSMSLGMGAGLENLGFAFVAVGLVVPVATLVLVNRAGAPAAQARFRPSTSSQQST